MHILVTNDDGYHARGIKKLISIAKQFGDVTVVAPDRPQSAMSHAITISTPLRLRKVTEEPGYREYISNGTPVDCMKLGQKVLFPDGAPDLVLSGINHGSNASSNVIYSGTMAAAIEAAIEGIPAIGFSLLDYSSFADFDAAEFFIKQIIQNVIDTKLPKYTCLNVNIPNIESSKIRGCKVSRQANATWREIYVQREDPFGIDYFWLDGEFKNDEDDSEGTDIHALKNNYLSIVPIHFDFTDHKNLKNIEQNFKSLGNITIA